jgi:hypothetical protein
LAFALYPTAHKGRIAIRAMESLARLNLFPCGHEGKKLHIYGQPHHSNLGLNSLFDQQFTFHEYNSKILFSLVQYCIPEDGA